ncbi:MAG: hypothetical protein ABJQ69_03655 [Ekhidna sp.]
MWINYLIFGFSLLILTQSCAEDADLRAIDVDIKYINNSAHSIQYLQPLGDGRVQEVFEIAPQSTHIISERSYEVVDGQDNPEECCLGLFQGFQSKGVGSDILIQFEDQKCLFFEAGTGPTTDNLLNGYTAEIVSDDFFEFTYIFTEDDYNKASTCEN